MPRRIGWAWPFSIRLNRGPYIPALFATSICRIFRTNRQNFKSMILLPFSNLAPKKSLLIITGREPGYWQIYLIVLSSCTDIEKPWNFKYKHIRPFFVIKNKGCTRFTSPTELGYDISNRPLEGLFWQHVLRKGRYRVSVQPLAWKATSLIEIETSTFGVSYERRRWPEKRPV